MDQVLAGFIFALIILGIFILGSAIRILREYERGVIFRLGRLLGAKGPGLILLIPIVDKMVRLDLRTITMDVPTQEVITRDNVPVRVNAIVYFHIVDAERAVVQVANYIAATSMISQTTLRSVMGQAHLDEVLAEREKINQRLQEIIDEQTNPWGIKVTTVEVRDVEIPQGMQRAIARQAEAERERRAKVIHADGEFQASDKLGQAADIITAHTGALQLRFLQTLTEISTEKTSTIVFPLPIDVLTAFMPKTDAKKSR